MHTILTETGDLYLNVLRASKYTDLIRILGKNLFQFPVILFERSKVVPCLTFPLFSGNLINVHLLNRRQTVGFNFGVFGKEDR